MRKAVFLLLLLASLTLACNLGRSLQDVPIVQAILPPSATPLPPTPTPTLTPSPTPTPTPTPLPEMRIAEGDHALFNGDWQAARSAFQQAQFSSLEEQIQVAALTGLGKTYWMSGDLQNALNTLRGLLQAYPNSSYLAEAHFFLGNVYAALLRPLDAAGAYQAYLDLRPSPLAAYVQELRGDAFSAASAYNEALTAYLASLSAPRLESSIPLEIKIAQTYAALGDYPTALLMYDDIYQRATADYTKAQVDFLKGKTALAAGQPDVAYAAFQDAVLSYPRAYPAYQSLVELVNAGQPVDELQRGIIDYFAGEYGVALAAIDRYLSAEPADPASARYYRGLTLRAVDESLAALDEWNVVIQGYPESPLWDAAWEQKAYTQWAYLGEYESARQTLEDFVQTAANHPRAAEFLFDAAQAAERGGNLDQAAILWRKVGFDYTTSSYAQRGFFLAGITDYRRGDYPTALDDFNRALLNAVQVEDKAAAMLWIGKTQQALGNPEEAQVTWQNAALLDPTGYYSERAQELLTGKAPFAAPENYALSRDLSAERAQAESWLRLTFSLPPEIDLATPASLASDDRFQRGNEFFRLGLYERASAEFDALRLALTADPAGTYRLANYLAELGLYRPAILSARQVLDQANLTDATTLTAPALFSHIRFGTYFADLVIPVAQQNSYHPLLIWSLIRQESFFERNARSSAGARGLMQIMPPTGEEMATRMGWPPAYTTADLDRPLVSITLGINYLRRQQDYLNGDLLAALAAYNGGAGNASLWQAMANGDPDLLLEVIRLEEPRNYIRRIYENYQIYLRLYAHTP